MKRRLRANKHICVSDEVHARLTVMKLALGMKRFDDVIDWLTLEWKKKLEKIYGEFKVGCPL